MFSRIVNSFSNALDLNLATLSGCIDVVVVPQENGTLKSSPFHVRFGKMKVLRSRQREVAVIVNGVDSGLRMKLGAAGEAFFEEPVEDDLEEFQLGNSNDNGCKDHASLLSLDATQRRTSDADIQTSGACAISHGTRRADADISPSAPLKRHSDPADSTRTAVQSGATCREPSPRTSEGQWSSSNDAADESYKATSRDVPIVALSPLKSQQTPGPAAFETINKSGMNDITSSSPQTSSPTPLFDVTVQPSSVPGVAETSSLELSMAGHMLSGSRYDAIYDNDCFEANIVSWETLNRDPMLWYHSSLVCRFDGQPPYYPGKVALPLLGSWVAFNRPLSLLAMRTLMETKIKTEPVQDRSLIGWVFGTAPTTGTDVETFGESSVGENSAVPGTQVDDDALADRNGSRGSGKNYNLHESIPTPNAEDEWSLCGLPRRLRRSLRPTSSQLAQMNLRYGSNTVCFIVSSPWQGEHSVSGLIYLWPMYSKIVVSDVDGTITKSDVLGQLMPIVGKDWSHAGVAELFSKCCRNNYRLLYLTARAIGQADPTREYLFGSRPGASMTLPKGALIMSPDRLFPSFKREVIDRKPYVFKIAALRDIRVLFPRNYNPFYAGFGNRDTDHRAYVHIGIPESRVFIIDKKGVVHHINTTFAKTYESLGEISDFIFPPIPAGPEATPRGEAGNSNGQVYSEPDEQVTEPTPQDCASTEELLLPADRFSTSRRSRVPLLAGAFFQCCSSVPQLGGQDYTDEEIELAPNNYINSTSSSSSAAAPRLGTHSRPTGSVSLNADGSEAVSIGS